MIFLKEFRMGQSVFGSAELNLRIGKSNPDFTDFIFGKSIINQFDLCTKESYIIQFFLQSGLGATPETGPFYVNANKIFIGKFLT